MNTQNCLKKKEKSYQATFLFVDTEKYIYIKAFVTTTTR